jgi:hypothetical protein
MRAHVPASTESRDLAGDPIFGRLLVGSDETPESLVAAAQAGVLRAPDGQLVLIAVVERYLATHAGLAAADAEDRLMAGTSADLARAHELVEADDTMPTSGRLVERLSAGARSSSGPGWRRSSAASPG